MKARLGDYLRKDGQIVEVVFVDSANNEYLTSDGGAIGEHEVHLDMILLPSEVIF